MVWKDWSPHAPAMLINGYQRLSKHVFHHRHLIFHSVQFWWICAVHGSSIRWCFPSVASTSCQLCSWTFIHAEFWQGLWWVLPGDPTFLSSSSTFPGSVEPGWAVACGDMWCSSKVSISVIWSFWGLGWRHYWDMVRRSCEDWSRADSPHKVIILINGMLPLT